MEAQQEKTRYPARHVWSLGRDLQIAFGPYTERVEIAGSLRRLRQDVGDLELVCVPRFTVVKDLFGVSHQGPDLLDQYIQAQISYDVFEVRVGPKGGHSYGPLQKFLVHKPTGIPVDVFCTTAENFGMTLFIRTGPKEWNEKVMVQFKNKGISATLNNGVLEGSKKTFCKTEHAVFDLLGWAFVDPWDRH